MGSKYSKMEGFQLALTSDGVTCMYHVPYRVCHWTGI